jgi:hypothetical protein
VNTSSGDVDPYERSRDLLLAEVGRNPEDARSVLSLAQSYFDSGDFDNARKWYARRVEIGGWDQEVYFAMLRVAESMAQLNSPQADVQDAYLKAWEFRPTRAESLYAIAWRYRVDGRYRPGYLFAKLAAEIPMPIADTVFVRADIYAWRANDEQAICASWIGKHAEALTLCRRVLARPDIPDGDRQRIAGNRDFSVPAMIEAASTYSESMAQRLVANRGDAEVVVSLVAGPDRGTTEQTLNSFLNCCTDVSRVGRILVSVTGSWSLPIAGPTSGSRRSASRSTNGSGCIWARAGGFLPPRISSPASRRCSKPKHKCSKWASTSPMPSS